jgi:hypothetical protein
MNDDNEPQFGNRIRHLLNQGKPLDASASARLRAARELAVSRQRPEAAQGLAWSGGILRRLGGPGGLSLRLIAPLLALAIGFAAVYVWQQKQRAAEIEELDALLLTDELPIDAYLDQGFEAWLKRRAAR